MLRPLFVVCHLSKRPKHFSALHSVVIVFAGVIRLLFKLLLKFRNVLKHSESRGKISKKTSPLRWRFSFALKLNEMKRHTCKQMLHENFLGTRE